MTARPRRALQLIAALVAVSVGWLCVPPPAVAQSKARQACFRAYEQGQRLQLAGQLRAAREQLIFCASTECPSGLRNDCAQWLTEVEAALPSIVVAAETEDGAEVIDVRVSVDGELLTEHLDGKAISVDPGQHDLQFELAGYPPVQRQLLIREGEKARRIEVQFATPEEAGDDRLVRRILSYVFGGGALAGLVVFAYYGTSGNSRLDDLDALGCKPSCPPEDVDAIRSDYRTANIALAISAASLAVGTYLFATSWIVPTESGAARRVELAIVPTGRSVSGWLGCEF